MFHWRDGWFFERLGSADETPERFASVHIIKRAEAKDTAPIIAEAVIPPSEWASIVATVSALGETGTTFRIFEAAQKG